MVAAAAAALWATVAFGQTTPADPLAPGAGADSGKVEAAPSSDAAAPADDNSKPAKPKHRESGLLTVTVHNDRLVGMVELRVGPAGSGDLKKAVGPLAFGRKTVIHLKRAKDCLYDVHAQFADEADTDQTSLDLCKDKNINLTD
jgi:hypothetical protein